MHFFSLKPKSAGVFPKILLLLVSYLFKTQAHKGDDFKMNMR